MNTRRFTGRAIAPPPERMSAPAERRRMMTSTISRRAPQGSELHSYVHRHRRISGDRDFAPTDERRGRRHGAFPCMMTTANLVKKAHPLKWPPIFLLWSLLLTVRGSAQAPGYPGPAETALAGSVAARTEDHRFAGTNPAALSGTAPLALLSFAPSALGIAGYHEENASALLPVTDVFRMGCSGRTLGAGAYHELGGTMQAAIDAPGDVTLGAALSYHALMIDGYGSTAAATVDLGALARLTDRIRFGAAISNVGRARLLEADIPQQLSFGFAFDIGTATTISLDAHHELRRPASLALGLSTMPLPELMLRAGIASAPATIAFGAGYDVNGILFEYGGAYIPPLGFRHVAGAGVRW